MILCNKRTHFATFAVMCSFVNLQSFLKLDKIKAWEVTNIQIMEQIKGIQHNLNYVVYLYIEYTLLIEISNLMRVKA